MGPAGSDPKEVWQKGAQNMPKETWGVIAVTLSLGGWYFAAEDKIGATSCAALASVLIGFTAKLGLFKPSK